MMTITMIIDDADNDDGGDGTVLRTERGEGEE